MPTGSRARRSLPAATVVLGAAALAAGGQSPAPSPQIPTFEAATELVYVRFHVEGKQGYLADLEPDQLRVLEDGRPQRVALLDTPSSEELLRPPEVTLLVDVSGSVMEARLLDEAMMRDVFIPALGAQTTVGLCAFGGELRCFVPPTRDVRALLSGFRDSLQFAFESRRSGTRLYASIGDVCAEPPTGERAKRALVVFTDGLDNRDGSAKEATQAALDGDVRVYAVLLSQAFREGGLDMRPGGGIGPGGSGGFGRGNPALYGYKKLELTRLVEDTGGRWYEPAMIDQRALAEILTGIATEIRMEFVVGYQPEGPPTGKKRKVKVELADKSLGKIKDGERTLVR